MPINMKDYARACGNWAIATFGYTVFENKTERCHRFLEEALELCQAAGVSKEEALMLADYVYNREAGEIEQEVGGVMVTLSALTESFRIDLDGCAKAEYFRINRPEIREKIRKKQATKPDSGPLPGPTEGEI